MARSLFPLLAVVTVVPCAAEPSGVGEIVRIPTPINARCINAKTDELTMTLRRIITQRTEGFFTEDKRAGVTVIATLNSDGNPTSKTPSVNLIDIESAPMGQVLLPLEYPVASLLPLSADSGKTFTKNMLLELYLDKVRGENTFGKVLDIAGSLLAKLPIPANPYTNAASEVLKFANDAITSETRDAGGRLFASITLQFNDRDEPDLGKCAADSYQATGAIAVVGATGAHNIKPLALGNLSARYCWRYGSENTYEVQYAVKPTAGCHAVPAGEYRELPNDYVMIVVSAQTIPRPSLENPFTKSDSLPRGSKRMDDLLTSKALCDAMRLAPAYCGVQ
jgi:hypothetical protein